VIRRKEDAHLPGLAKFIHSSHSAEPVHGSALRGLVLTIDRDGLLTAKADPACVKEHGHCRDLHTTDFTTELSLW